jgi:hypothetical protein
VGVVRLGEGGVGPLVVGRTLVVGGGLHHPPLTIPVGSGALVYQPAGVAGSGPLDVVQGLQTRMREEEAALARTFLREDRPPPAPGRTPDLPGRRGSGGGGHQAPVPGLSSPQSAPILGVLEPGERTPLFLIGDQRLERYAWYTRIARGREIDGALTGILRLEVSTAMGMDRARTVADATTLLLPGLASDRVRDPRAPQNLYPVGRLEAVLPPTSGGCALHPPGHRDRTLEGTWLRETQVRARVPRDGARACRIGGAGAGGRPGGVRRFGVRRSWGQRSWGQRSWGQHPVGNVLGTEASTPLAWWVAIHPEAYLQLDDVVQVTTQVPGVGPVVLSGVVDQVRSRHEGSQFESDVFLAREGVFPLAVARSARVVTTRVEPEIWVPRRRGIREPGPGRGPGSGPPLRCHGATPGRGALPGGSPRLPGPLLRGWSPGGPRQHLRGVGGGHQDHLRQLPPLLHVPLRGAGGRGAPHEGADLQREGGGSPLPGSSQPEAGPEAAGSIRGAGTEARSPSSRWGSGRR